MPLAAFAFGSIAFIPILAGQPKEVTVAFYAAFMAVMSVAAGVIFVKKNMRFFAVGAALTCAAFMAIFVIYAYLAYGAHR